MITRATYLALLILLACGGRADDGADASADSTEESTFELRDVVSAALAARPPRTAPEPLDLEQESQLEGLTTLVASDPDMRSVAADDVARIGSAAWSKLAEIARAAGRTDAERAAAVDLIEPVDPYGAEALLVLVTDADPAWVRARAAWRLASDGPDALVPALILRLKYEKDHETVVWIAVALARHDNLAGVEGLVAIANEVTSPARTNAEQQLGLLLERNGCESAAVLLRKWGEGAQERGVPEVPRSEAYRYAILDWIARLSEFQLRGVDDARFVLERMGTDAARELAAALHEEDVYVRVHAAQCLQRMGRRGTPAGPELLRALAEPELAPHAAAALGHIGYAPAETALVQRLVPDTPLDLRLSCARALGRLPSLTPEVAAQVLRPLLDADSPELSQATAESLLRRDPGAYDVAQRLADFVEDTRVDPVSSERALREWLHGTKAAEALARWDELEAPLDRAETPAETRLRRSARVAIVRELVGR